MTMRPTWTRSFIAAVTLAAAMLWGAPSRAEPLEHAAAVSGQAVRLRNVGTGHCISATPERGVRTTYCSTDPSQRWHLRLLRSPMTRIVSGSAAMPDMCLGALPESDVAVMRRCRLSAWSDLSRHAPGRICSPRRVTPERCLEAGGAGEPLRLRPEGTSDRQLWEVVP